MKRVIRLGDPTDHGGHVVSAASTTTLFGKNVACIGDAVSCPRQGHNNCVIVEGDPSWSVGGKAVALEGHKTSCGAVLISTMGEVSRSYEASSQSSAGPATSPPPASALASNSDIQFDDKYRLVDPNTQRPIANHLYAIERENGDIEHGQTDADGHTHLLSSIAAKENIKIYLEG